MPLTDEATMESEMLAIMRSHFAHLSEEGLTNEVITKCARLPKIMAQLAAVGINKLIAETLPPEVGNVSIWSYMVKLEQGELQILGMTLPRCGQVIR